MLSSQRSIGQHERVVVERRATRQPLRCRFGTDEGEQGVARQTVSSPSLPGDPHGASISIAVERDDLGVRPHVDCGCSLDALDEVARHARVEIRATDDDRDRAPRLGEEQRCLSGRVAAAGDDDR